MQSIDVGTLLDEGHWSSYQKLLIVGTALTIIFDGLDNQLLGAAIPALMREWGQPRAVFASVLTSGFVGMMIGGAIGGVIGDRVGRRVALLASVVTFGALTVLVSFSGSVTTLGVLRFFAGLGLGGAMPNAAALSSEYVPRRHRPFAVTLTVVCIPLGGTLAGILSAEILPTYGWRALFLVGGLVPIVLALVLVKVLPESPRYLARRRERWPELASLLRKLGHDVAPGATFVDAAEKAVVQVSARQLLAPEFRRDTLALTASFFFCLLSVYVGVNWVPSLLRDAGFDLGVASNGLTAFNLGGVVGAIAGAILIGRIGSRITMLAMAAGAIAGGAMLATVSVASQSAFAVLAMLAWTGGLTNAVQTTMYGLATHVYPTAIRATGVGTAVAIGRIGGIAAPYAGAWALDSGGAPRLFALMAGTMTLVFAALASLRNHIPRASAARAVEIADCRLQNAD
ncbi:MAG TPA: MFS transporter [Vicinamibacterales bacterium]|jgi:AAHS family 4-hydroxybenzoate transporter-like MFS transporter|nr:MFS transporter [Vicinamibacterales bacterium]